MLQVAGPSLLATIQDAGRPDFADLGVPPAGACDPWARAAANLILGNAPDAPVLELTLSGPDLLVEQTGVLALAGADLGALVAGEARPLPPGAAYLVRGGSTIRFGRPRAGARAYLALPGGIVVPRVLGAAATYLPGAFGGFDGRALRPGDRLAAARPADRAAAGRQWPDALAPPPYAGPAVARVVLGPDSARFAPEAVETLAGSTWTVAPQSDRMGLRLQGPRLAHASPADAQIVSRGVVWGALQVPADGQPICLLADHQTVGGYPVIGVVARADFAVLAQLPPGATLRFRVVRLAEAQSAYRAQAAGLAAAAVALARPDPWDALPDAR